MIDVHAVNKKKNKKKIKIKQRKYIESYNVEEKND